MNPNQALIFHSRKNENILLNFQVLIDDLGFNGKNELR